MVRAVDKADAIMLVWISCFFLFWCAEN